MSPMRNFRSNPAQRRDHYQELTGKIIAALEAGTAPWRRPWDKTACGGASQRRHRPSLPRAVSCLDDAR
jgi:antirestriction protein ArdC